MLCTLDCLFRQFMGFILFLIVVEQTPMHQSGHTSQAPELNELATPYLAYLAFRPGPLGQIVTFFVTTEVHLGRPR